MEFETQNHANYETRNGHGATAPSFSHLMSSPFSKGARHAVLRSGLSASPGTVTGLRNSGPACRRARTPVRRCAPARVSRVASATPLKRLAPSSASGSSGFHVTQHLRPSFPRHDLGRKPRARHRLRRGRMPAGHSPDGSGSPGVSRQASARPVALRDPAPGTRRGGNPVRRLSRRRRPARDHGHADLAPHPQCRSALEGLWRHRREIPARTRRLHLSGQVRTARLSRRRTLIGA